MSESPSSIRESWKFVFLVIFLVGMVLGSSALKLPERFSAEAIRGLILGTGFWGPLIFGLLYALSSLVVFPTALLSIQSGVVWGPLWGTVYTVVASTLASIIPYLLAKHFGHGFVGKFSGGAKTRICDRFFVKNGFITILLIRLIPILPWDAVNYGAGLCGFRLRDYGIATLIGSFPVSLAYNLIGASLGEPLSRGKISLIVAIGIGTLGLALYLQRIGTRIPAKPCRHSG